MDETGPTWVLGFRLDSDSGGGGGLAGRIFDTFNMIGHHFIDPVCRPNQNYSDSNFAVQSVSKELVAGLARWTSKTGCSSPAFAEMQARMEAELGMLMPHVASAVHRGGDVGFQIAWSGNC